MERDPLYTESASLKAAVIQAAHAAKSGPSGTPLTTRRVLLLGTKGCGKTTLINRTLERQSPDDGPPLNCQPPGLVNVLTVQIENGISREKILVEMIEINDEIFNDQQRCEDLINSSDLFIFMFKLNNDPSDQPRLWQMIEMVRKVKDSSHRSTLSSSSLLCASAILGNRSNLSELYCAHSKATFVENKARAIEREKGFWMRCLFERENYSCEMLIAELIEQRLVKESEQIMNNKNNNNNFNNNNQINLIDLLLLCLSMKKVEKLYDYCTIIISLADFLTDLWVLRQWYLSSRMLPFYLSLIILLVAQCAYVILFLTKYINEKWSVIKIIMLSLILLTISPLLSLVIFLLSDTQSYLFQWMYERGFNMKDPMPDRKNQSQIEIFIQEKLAKHMGFLLEAGVEAFPQSILQMSVMVWYNESNWVSVVSILLSLISVCSKSLVFSSALELRTFFFNYLSIVLDFITMFSMVAWLFYRNQNNNNNNDDGGDSFSSSISIWVWFYFLKVIFVTAPIAIGGGFAMAAYKWAEMLSVGRKDLNDCLSKLVFNICTALILCIIWLFGCVFGTLMLELSCCSLIAAYFTATFSNRFSMVDAQPVLWGKILGFIYEGSDWNDKLLRVCLVNDTFFKNLDSTSQNYIRNNRQTIFSQVTWKGLRMNIRQSKIHECGTPKDLIVYQIAKKWDDIKRDFKHHYTCGYRYECSEFCNNWDEPNGPAYETSECIHPCCWFAGMTLWFPLYLISRLFHFIFVWILILSKMQHWSDINALQWIMAGIQFCLQLGWMMSLISVMQLNFLTWHLIPGSNWISVRCLNEHSAIVQMNRLQRLHLAHTIEPQRRTQVIDILGPDIGGIVLLYLTTLLHDLGEEVGDSEKKGKEVGI